MPFLANGQGLPTRASQLYDTHLTSIHSTE
jgi:hypothetical protein